MFSTATFVGPRPARRRIAFIAAALAVVLSCWGVGRLRPRLAAAAMPLYRPCPSSREPCRILPLGDSLTSGIGYEGGYRVALFELARAAGKRITFTGSLQNGPMLADGVAFPRRHEGRSGWKIAGVMATVPQPALKTVPHIVLLHVGTNDVYAHESPAQMVERAEQLIDRLKEAAPRALIVVAEIIPQTDPVLRDRSARYNAELRRCVETRQARGEHVLIVDQFSHFPLTLLSDGVHPTQSGYEQMGRAWYAAIAAHLP